MANGNEIQDVLIAFSSWKMRDVVEVSLDPLMTSDSCSRLRIYTCNVFPSTGLIKSCMVLYHTGRKE